MHFLQKPWQPGLSSVWPILLLWLVIAVPYTVRTPGNSFSHDFGGHLQYAQILHDAKRLPLPGEGWETHQPPLYYLIISRMRFSTSYHVLFVRLFSVFLGASVIVLISQLLHRFGVSGSTGCLSLGFLITTPHFLFIFSTYNNDALLVCLGVFAWLLFMQFAKTAGTKTLIGLWVVSVLGLLTKLTYVAVIASLLAASVYLIHRKALSRKGFFGLWTSQLLAIPTLLLWMYFHNYQTSGLWLPTNWQGAEAMQHIPHSAMETILTPPGFTTWEWVTPFTDHFLPIGKKNSLTAYMLVSSVFGEHPFQQMREALIWFILWVHTVWLLLAFTRIRRTQDLSLMGVALGLGWLALAAYVFVLPYGTSMDFRYVAWLYLPLTILRADVLDHPPVFLEGRARQFFLTLLVLCFLDQWILISLL